MIEKNYLVLQQGEAIIKSFLITWQIEFIIIYIFSARFLFLSIDNYFSFDQHGINNRIC